VGGTWTPPGAVRIQRRFRRQTDGSVAVSFEGQDLADLLLWSVRDLVQTAGARLTTCAREGCGRWFLRRKRGAYCSGRCSQKVRNDRVRDRLSEDARAARNQRRRERYERQQRQKLGPVKIARRRTVRA
jgi:hypothetical protein